MTFSRASLTLVVVWILLLGGCATRQVNPPIAKYDPGSLHQIQQRWHRGEEQDLVILAFSGGGTRAAAFSYGVLETSRNIPVITKTIR
jgi:NTE family protein